MVKEIRSEADAMVKGILSDAVEKIRERCELSMKSQNEEKYKTLVEELFVRYKPLFNNLADFTTDGATVPADVCHFHHRLPRSRPHLP